MRAEAQIKELVRKDGFLYTKDVVTVGIRKEKLKELLEEGLLMRGREESIPFQIR